MSRTPGFSVADATRLVEVSVMPNVLLGVTGSVAAIKTPELYAALRERSLDVKVVATKASLYFFDPLAIGTETLMPATRNSAVMILDDDEWPGRGSGQHYHRDDSVLHIELRRWADLLLIAPLDANTLAKLANGLADNCLTCVWRAWDPARPEVLAPAMNTLMWRHPLTRRHLRQLAADARADGIPDNLDESAVAAAINERSPTLRIVTPQVKELACGDVGVGAMADVATILDSVLERLATHS
jgi:phosphopantothenoylcysteine decarboxylase